MNAQPTYTINTNLLTGVIRTLEQLPAAQSRGLLNAIEAEIQRQDQERNTAEHQALREQLKAELAPKPETTGDAS